MNRQSLNLSRRGRLVAATAVVGLIGLSSTVVAAAPTPSDPAPTPVVLEGVGSGGIAQAMLRWAEVMYTASTPVSLGFVTKGDRDARAVFASGQSTFAVSGRPMTEADTTALASRGVGSIRIPLASDALMFAVQPPYKEGLRTYTPPPDEESDIEFEELDRDWLYLPTDLLARSLIDRTGGNFWGNRDLRAANNVDGTGGTKVLDPNGGAPFALVRTDPSASNYELARMLEDTIPAVWREELKAAKVADWSTYRAGEEWPLLKTPSRSGSAAIAGLLASWLSPVDGTVPTRGVLGVTSPADGWEQFFSTTAATRLYIGSVRNQLGEWTYPVPSAITGGVADRYTNANAAPGSAPVTSAGSYPYAWDNAAYVPDRGMDVTTVNAMAAFLTYALTTGQRDAEKVNVAPLPAPLVLEGISGVFEMVRSNCAAITDGRAVTVASGGRYWPASVPVPFDLPQCSVPGDGVTPVPTTTAPAGGPSTTTTPTTVPAPPTTAAVETPVTTLPPTPGFTPVGDAGSFSSSFGPLAVSAAGIGLGADFTPAEVEGFTEFAAEEPVGVEESAPAGGTGPSGEPSAGPQLAAMPLPLPGGGPIQLDQFATLLLGAALFLMGRGALRAMRQKGS